MKPGIKTTEFWMTLIVVVLGAIQDSGIITKASISSDIGTALTVLAALGYTYSRTVVKGNAPQ
jgi:hypothetical protein